MGCRSETPRVLHLAIRGPHGNNCPVRSCLLPPTPSTWRCVKALSVLGLRLVQPKFGTMNATVRICIFVPSSEALRFAAHGWTMLLPPSAFSSFFLYYYLQCAGFSFFPDCARPFWFFPFPICARASDECNSTLRLSRCSTALL